MKKPEYILGEDDLYSKIGSHDNLVVLMFTAHWCGPCSNMKEYISYQLTNYGNCLMVYVDVDEEANEDLCSKYHIESLPTFKLGYIESGKFKIETQVTGANKTLLDKVIKEKLK
jgi:thiol-disulfide isomerase/thioredoxin